MSIARLVHRTGTLVAALAGALLLLVFGAVFRPAPASAAELLGNSQLAGYTDRNEAGVAEAFVSTAGGPGLLRSLRLFIDDRSAASAVELGVYADADGEPGALLTSGRITQPLGGRWNAVDVAPIELVAGRDYWLVVLPTGGALAFRDFCCGNGTKAVTTPASTPQATLPTRWTTGDVWQDGPASLYGSTDPAPAPSGGGADAATIGVDLAHQLQTVDGVGVNANVHSWENGRLRPAIDQLAAAGVTTWRVIIDRCDFEATNDDADPAHFNMGYYADVYERGKMADLWNTLAYIESKPGATVVLNCMGGVPAWMGGTIRESRIDASAEDEWVEMLASLVYYGREVKHLGFKLLSPANEIDWDGNEGPQIAPDQYVRLLHKLSVRLDGLGLDDIRFVGPDTAFPRRATVDYYPAMAADPVVMKKVARVGVHTYYADSASIDDAIDESPYPDLPWWVTEFSAWCDGCDSGAPNPADWSFAGEIGDQMFSLLDQGASGMQLYDGWDGYYEHHGAVGYWGAMAYDALSGTYSPRKSYSVLRQFTQFVPKGAIRTEADSSTQDLRVESFHDPATGRVTLVLKNDRDQALTTTVDLGSQAVGRLQSYVTNAQLNFAPGAAVDAAGTTFTLSVPADSMMTLTGLPADGAPPTVVIQSPRDGALVAGTVPVVTSVGDDTGVSRVEFSVDGRPVGTDSQAPFGFDLDTTALADGTHTVGAVAYDLVGHASAPASVTVRVDNTGTTIGSGPDAVTSNAAPLFTFSSSDPGATFECRVDGPDSATGTFRACESPLQLSTLSDGAYRLLVRAVDPAGNVDPSPATREFVVDTRAPDAPALSAPADGHAQTTRTITFRGTTEPRATVSVTEGEASRGTTVADVAGAWSLTVAAVPEGVHHYMVRARDGAGNTSAGVALSVTVDTVAPDTLIASGPTGETNDSSPRFAFASPEPDVMYECQLDGPGAAAGAFAPCPAQTSFPRLVDGRYTLTVRAVDPAGNQDPDPATRTFVVDTVAPAAPTITAPQDGSVQAAATVALRGTAEPGTTVVVEEDAATRGSTTVDVGGGWALDITGVDDGEHAFTARSRDAAGNTSGAASVRVRVDGVALDTTILTGPSGTTRERDSAFTFTGSRPGATFECRLDGPGAAVGAFEPCTSPKSYTGLGDGAYTLRVRALDGTGNADESPATRAFLVDATAPDSAIAGGPSGPSNDASPAFGLSSSEADAAFECRLDGPAGTLGAWRSCATTLTLAALADGDYALSVRAVDRAGNSDPSPARRTFSIDTVAPDTSIDSGPAALIPDGAATFAFTSSEPGTRTECRLEGPETPSAVFEACGTPKRYSALPDGDYAFSVRSMDAAGNTDPSPAGRTFTVRSPGPERALLDVQPAPPVTTPGPTPIAPTYRRTVIARPVSGTVLVRAAGVRSTLAKAEPVSIGSTIDARTGEVELTAEAKAGGARYTAVFRGGVFTVAQTSTGTELRLSEALAPCDGGRSTKPHRRRLWGEGKGPFSIRGAYSSALSRNGRWLVEDSCRGTTTRVARGVAQVTQRGKRSPVTLKAGKTHRARPRG